MKASTKQIAADVSKALSDAITGETVNKKIKKAIEKSAKEIAKKLTEIEEALMQTKIKSGQDALNYPIRLNNKIAALGSTVDSSDDAPTVQSYVVYEDLTSQIDAQLSLLAKIKSEDIAEFNKQFAAKGLPVIIPGK